MDAPGATQANESVPQDRRDSDPNNVGDNTYPDSGRSDRVNDEEDSHNGTQSEGDDTDKEHDEDGTEEESDDEEDEEPRLKYAYLTKHLGAVYRNGDATSSFLAAGDKMVLYPGIS